MGQKRGKKRANGEGSVFPRSDGRWAGSFTLGFDSEGRQKRFYVYARTQAEALQKLTKRRRDHEDGRPLSPPRQTVAEFLKTWLETSEPSISPKSHRTYSDLVRLHIVPELGHIDLYKLGPDHVQQFVNRKSKEGLSPTTVKHCRDCLRAALNLAMRWNQLQRNPAALVKLPKRVKRTPQVYNKAQSRQFLETIHGHRLEALFLVALCMGVREGEVLGLGKPDVDLEGKRLHIRHSLQRLEGKLQLLPTKTDESQRSPVLPDVVASALAAHFARQEAERTHAGSDWVETGMVFTTTKGTMLDARNMLREYYRLRDLAELPKIRFHDLRHSAATLLHAAGVPMASIQKLLGHASMRTTQDVYSHTTTDMESEAANTMDEIFSQSPSATIRAGTRARKIN
jgi:integrase